MTSIFSFALFGWSGWWGMRQCQPATKHSIKLKTWWIFPTKGHLPSSPFPFLFWPFQNFHSMQRRMERKKMTHEPTVVLLSGFIILHSLLLFFYLNLFPIHMGIRECSCSFGMWNYLIKPSDLTQPFGSCFYHLVAVAQPLLGGFSPELSASVR